MNPLKAGAIALTLLYMSLFPSKSKAGYEAAGYVGISHNMYFERNQALNLKGEENCDNGEFVIGGMFGGSITDKMVIGLNMAYFLPRSYDLKGGKEMTLQSMEITLPLEFMIKKMYNEEKKRDEIFRVGIEPGILAPFNSSTMGYLSSSYNDPVLGATLKFIALTGKAKFEFGIKIFGENYSGLLVRYGYRVNISGNEKKDPKKKK